MSQLAGCVQTGNWERMTLQRHLQDERGTTRVCVCVHVYVCVCVLDKLTWEFQLIFSLRF